MLNTEPVAITVEMSANLYQALQCFTQANPDWTEDRAISSALMLFLLQMQGGHDGQSTD